MSYKQIIEDLKPFDYSRYSTISSYEKLMVFAAYTLEKLGVPLTFNYICIAAFKLFPDRFCCDEEFSEFPSVDRLNRTMMHLKYVSNGRSALTGSVENGYSLTNLGRANAIEVESIISNTAVDERIKAPIVDKHKKGVGGDYLRMKESDGYKKYLETGEIDKMFVWKFYNATPFTQMKTIRKNISEVAQYADDADDKKCLEFLEKIKEIVQG